MENEKNPIPPGEGYPGEQKKEGAVATLEGPELVEETSDIKGVAPEVLKSPEATPTPEQPREAAPSAESIEAPTSQTEAVREAERLKTARELAFEQAGVEQGGIAGEPSGREETYPEPPTEEELERMREAYQEARVELTPEQSARLEGIAREYNMTVEELEGVKGFTDLSYGQRRLVFENFQQVSLGRIQEEAIGAHREDTAQSKFLGRIWKGITKKYQIAKHEKRAAQQIKNGGIGEHGKVLEQLVHGTKESGLEAVERAGNLEIQYASGFENLTPEQGKKVQQFNEAATTLARLPYEWSLETATADQREAYQEANQAYQAASKEVISLKRDQLKSQGVEKTGQEAALAFGKIDNLVRLNQFLNTHPEVERELQHLTSEAAWKKALKDIVTERGLYLSGGFLARGVATGLLGAIGIPLAAAGMGAAIARMRGKEHLREQDILARRGVEGKGPEAKELNDTSALVEKMEALVGRITEESDRAKQLKAVKQLQSRITYTQGKIAEGMVNFGGKEERLANQYTLIDKLNLAVQCAKQYEIREKTQHLERPEVEKRLERILNLKRRNVSEARRTYLLKQMGKGALYGAGLASIGVAVRELWDHLDVDVRVRWRSPEDVGAARAAPVPEIPTATTTAVMGPEAPTPSSAIPHTEVTGAIPPQATEQVPVAGKVAEQVAKAEQVSSIEVVSGKMNSIWKMAEDQLEKRGFFKGLTGTSEEIVAKKTYLIDAIKDRVAKNPSEFGLTDLDKLEVGQKVDLSHIFEKQDALREALLLKADKLSTQEVASILEHNQKILEFHTQHPEVPITSENVDTIAAGRGDELLARAAEAAPPAPSAVPPEVAIPTEAVATPEAVNLPPESTMSREEAVRTILAQGGDIDQFRPEDLRGLQPEEIAQLRIQHRVGELYKGGPQVFEKMGIHRPNQIEEWDVMKGRTMLDVLEGKFGAPVGNQLDAAEVTNRHELQAYLREEQAASNLDPRPGETVEEYLKRAEIHQIQTHLILGGVEGTKRAEEALDIAIGAYLAHPEALEGLGAKLGTANVKEILEWARDQNVAEVPKFTPPERTLYERLLQQVLEDFKNLPKEMGRELTTGERQAFVDVEKIGEYLKKTRP